MLVPFYSMISLVTRNAYERGFLGNVQQIFQTLGNVVVNATFVVLLKKFSESAETIYTQRSFTLTMLVFCIVMVITSMIAFFFTKERVTDTEAAEDKSQNKAIAVKKAGVLETVKALLTNKYWVILTIAMFVIFFVIIFSAVGAVYYCQYVFADMDAYSWMSNSTSIAQFAIMFAVPVFLKKFDKHQVYTAGMGIMVLGYIGFGLTADMGNMVLMIIFNALKGCGVGISGGVALGMVADAITYGQLKSGIDAVGMGNAGVSAAQKIGMGLGTAIFGFILSGAGFDGKLDAQGIAQPETVVTAIKFVYTWIPLVMIAIVFILLILFYRNIEKDLKALKAQHGIMD